MAQMPSQEVLRHVEAYRKITNNFVRRTPFCSVEELKKLLNGREGIAFMGREKGNRCLFALSKEQSYLLIKRIYETAGNKPEVNKEVGRELNKLGGFDMMQGAFYVLTNYSPLSRAGRLTGDPDQSTWLYSILQSDWDGIGTWLA